MDVLLDELGQLMLKALPTVILLILLHLYLKWIFYRPLDSVLRERYEATGGARQAAEESVRIADAKAKEYDEALRHARAELLREQEDARLRLRLHQSEEIAMAHKRNAELVRAARQEIAAEIDRAQRNLEGETDALAEQIVGVLLERKAD